MGKTSLLRAAFGAVEGTVLWASGAEGEAHVAHGITDQLIRSSPLGRDDREGLRASIGSDPLAMGAAIDRFGWFGVEQVALSWPRALGILLLAAGAALALRK